MEPKTVTLTPHRDSDFESSNISVHDNKLDGIDLSSNSLDYCIRKSGRNILWCFGRLLNLVENHNYYSDKSRVTLTIAPLFSLRGDIHTQAARQKM